MSVKIKTEVLQEMVSRAVRGASNSGRLITSVIGIELKDEVLTLTTTDENNYLYIREEGVKGKDFYAVTLADRLAKLVLRTTADTITLKKEKNSLVLIGNGTYHLELVNEADGSLVVFDDVLGNLPKDFKKKKKKYTINLATVLQALTLLKPSLDTPDDKYGAKISKNPCYLGYYVGEKMIATDNQDLSSLDVKLFDGEERLISAEMMNLLGVMMAENIKVELYENILIFTTPDCVLYGTVLNGIEDYQADDIMNLLNMKMSKECEVAKDLVLQALNRVSLFVDNTDGGVILCSFGSDELSIASQSGAGEEQIEYVTSKKSKKNDSFDCFIRYKDLIARLKSLEGETVKICYGADNFIKIDGGSIVHLVGLGAVEVEKEIEVDEDDEESEE